ncbi:MAG: SMC-Scp complex subunit ScpB [Atopostipes suicloacalis]|nr:SMC-Scp complex subunit ScpB [Atopostipes suicloacalis]
MDSVAKIEALLYVAGDNGLSVDILSELTGLRKDQTLSAVEELSKYYDNHLERGLKLIETANVYQIVTKREYAEIIKKYAQSPYSQKLSRALLETLAIVAYKQPITRIEIEEIRGVQVTGNLSKLKSRQLIKEVGHLDKPGSPILYASTDFFLDYFGINSLEELPELSEENDNIELTDLFFENYEKRIEKTKED